MTHALAKPLMWLWLLAASLAGCSATGYDVAGLASEINATRDTARAQFVAGDTVQVRFPFRSDLNHDARVRSDGRASFLLVDEVEVAGLTVEVLDEKLTGLYRAQKQDVDLTVSLVPGIDLENGHVVYVIGEVARPGPVNLDSRTLTLIEAIGEAGGLLKESANPSNVMLVRRVVATNAMRKWELDCHPEYWGTVPPVFLQPGDIIVVPNTAIDEVNIWVDKYIRQMLPFPYLVPFQ